MNLLLALVLFLSVGSSTCYADDQSDESTHLPCKFLDSLNITDGIKGNNETIRFDGITFDRSEYATFDYVLVNGTHKRPVQPHIRGCVCKIKPCIRLRCPPGTFWRSRDVCYSHAAAQNVSLDIIDRAKGIRRANIFQEFSHVLDRPCQMFYIERDEWSLTETGQIVVTSNDSSFEMDHREYMLLVTYDETAQQANVRLFVCFVEYFDSRFVILPIGMLLSVPFIVATILVYLCLPELRNVHGKCLLGYLVGLAFGYSILSAIQLNGNRYIHPTICKTAGYAIYFSFLSAFLWLNIISIDLWWNFKGTKCIKVLPAKKRITCYSIYAWGLSLAFTLLAFELDSSSSVPTHFQPGIGAQSCFLKQNRISEAIFFYVPIAIIIIINLIFFVLTARKIRNVQESLSKITATGDSSRHQSHLESEKDKFTLFLRLFIIMGVTWSTEAISWAVSSGSNYFYATDIFNTIQGVLIFILFVLKPKIKTLIKKRWKSVFSKDSENDCTKSSNSSVNTKTSSLQHADNQ